MSDYVLRTLAAVHPAANVLLLGNNQHVLSEALKLLGFQHTVFQPVTYKPGHSEPAPGDTANDKVSFSGEAEPGASQGYLPFPDQKFDWIVATQVWEGIHPKRMPTLLADCARVIKIGGWIIVAFRPIEKGANQSVALTIETLEQNLLTAGFAPASRWSTEEAEGKSHPYAIFRRTGENMIA